MASSVASLFPQRPELPDSGELARYIRLAMDVERRGMTMGKRPFGAILVGPDVTPVSYCNSNGRGRCYILISVWELQTMRRAQLRDLAVLISMINRLMDSLSIPSTLFVDLHVIHYVGTMRNVCGHYLLGEYRESSVWCIE